MPTNAWRTEPMKTITPAATALACMLLAAPATAQSVTGMDGRNSPASVRCSALADLEENARAGYGSGQRDAMNFATSGPSDLLSTEAPEADIEGGGAAGDQAQPEQGDDAAAPVAPSEEQAQPDAATQQGQAQQEPVQDEQAQQEPVQGEQAQQDATQQTEAQQDEAAQQSEEVPGATSGGPSVAVIPEVPVDAVLAACAQSPNSRVIDIVVAQGAIATP
jgi:hypothetical protein